MCTKTSFDSPETCVKEEGDANNRCSYDVALLNKKLKTQTDVFSSRFKVCTAAINSHRSHGM